jgi:hypothetical protein
VVPGVRVGCVSHMVMPTRTVVPSYMVMSTVVVVVC